MENAVRLNPDEILRWIAGLLAEGRRVWAPLARDGVRFFGELHEPAEARLEAGPTRWSAKEAFFPRSETLFSWSTAGDVVEVTAEPTEAPAQVLLGVPPCDAAAFVRLDSVLGADPAYAARRSATTVVGLACQAPDAACFCTRVGGSMAGEEGSDLQMLRDGEDVVLRALTPRGGVLLSGVSGRPAEADVERLLARARASEPAPGPRLDGQAETLEAAFECTAWDAAGERCLGCAACAAVCPSCSCFDVRDEGSAACGSRCRSWDSCGLALFTVHASGHNPRPTATARHRQRALHKFAYFPLRDPEGRTMCTGCGRCIRVCPAGLDVRETLSGVVEAVRGDRP
jgi:ferredoxin